MTPSPVQGLTLSTVSLVLNVPVHDSAKPASSVLNEFSSHGCRRTVVLGCADLMKEKRSTCVLMHQKLDLDNVVESLDLKWFGDNKSKCLMVGIETGGIHPCFACTAYRWNPKKKKKVNNGWYPCYWKDEDEDGVEERTLEKCERWYEEFCQATGHMEPDAALKLQSNFKNQVKNDAFLSSSD